MKFYPSKITYKKANEFAKNWCLGHVLTNIEKELLDNFIKRMFSQCGDKEALIYALEENRNDYISIYLSWCKDV